MNAFLKHYLTKTLKSLIELRQIVESGGPTPAYIIGKLNGS